MRRLVRNAAVASAAAAALIVSSPATALARDGETDSFGHASTAGSSCPGWVIKQGTLRAKSGHGTWQLFYSSARGGTNCLIVHNNSGGTHYMAAQLVEPDVAGGTDWGYYKSYAGPITVWQTAGHCMNLFVSYEETSYRITGGFCR